ncbi:hypothetical protein [Gemmatimonas sp.]|nr:hypothetical protein [Gemmatimonas sp.]
MSLTMLREPPPLGAGATLKADARTLLVHRQGLIDSLPLARTPEPMP